MIKQTYIILSTSIKEGLYSLVSIVKVLVLSKFNTQISKGTKPKCFVLANGPSFKKAYTKDKKPFLNTPCIVSNNFPVSEQFIEIKPAYCVWLDPYMWTSDNENVKQTIRVLVREVDWKLTLLVPFYAKNEKVIKEISSNPHIQITHYNYTYFNGLAPIAHWFYKQNLACPRALNVTVVSLFLGINLGFKEINLVGADHTLHENLHMSYDNVLNTQLPHFFDKKKEIKLTPNYRNGNPKNGTNTSYDFFLIWARTFKGYLEIEKYAKNMDSKIYTIGSDSFIDAFERKELS